MLQPWSEHGDRFQSTALRGSYHTIYSDHTDPLKSVGGPKLHLEQIQIHVAAFMVPHKPSRTRSPATRPEGCPALHEAILPHVPQPAKFLPTLPSLYFPRRWPAQLLFSLQSLLGGALPSSNLRYPPFHQR